MRFTRIDAYEAGTGVSTPRPLPRRTTRAPRRKDGLPHESSPFAIT